MQETVLEAGVLRTFEGGNALSKAADGTTTRTDRNGGTTVTTVEGDTVTVFLDAQECENRGIRVH